MGDQGRHTATLIIDGEDLRCELKCHGGPFSQCRQHCAEPSCEDEEYNCMTLDDEEGWTHLHHSYDSATDTESEVPHQMTDGGECMVLLFITEGGYPQEFFEGEPGPLNDTEIEYRWDGDTYMWKQRAVDPPEEQ